MWKSMLIVLGFAAAGVFGAVTADLLHPDAPPEAFPGKETSRQDALLEQLVGQMERLDRRLEILEQAPPMAAAPDAIAGPSAPAAAALESPALDLASITPELLEEKVREAVKESREAERTARGQRFSSWASQRQETLFKRLAEEHGLTDYQKTEMVKILARRREAIGSYHRVRFSADGSVSDAEIERLRVKSEAVRTETMVELQHLLTADQYEAYSQEQDRRRSGTRGNRGGREERR